jgi:2-hydroxychromene-2-carboxylate isomerase
VSKQVEFYFDFGSPTSYLAWTQLPAIVEQAGAELLWRPVLLGGIFQATGNASPVSVPAKGRWMLQDLGRFARRYGVPLSMNPHFPVNTLQLMRGAVGMQRGMPERFHDYVTAIFQAMWMGQANLGDAAVTASVLTAAGFDPDAVTALGQAQESKDRLRSETEAAVKRGLFGVPTLFVGGDMYFGQDRLDFVREALAAA